MITRDNIKDILLSPPFSFSDNRGVFARHYGTADEGFTLEYSNV